MKLVEIKNNLAKLYYQPADFPLAISDFLTIDDGNQKVLAQTMSIEATNKGDTNCAILKLALNLDVDNNVSTYGGYVPSLDALVSKTKAKILSSIFSGQASQTALGRMTNSSHTKVNFSESLLENNLYIQADKLSDINDLQNKIIAHCAGAEKKLLVIDTENTCEYENIQTVLELGKNFKLPINNEILNYIYENDLTGLPVEQKTIVQDIILEIQEYIDSLENKYIPFNTLLDVVNGIYETDKSVGIILFRNKLIKYKQYNIFASEESEFFCLNEAIQNSGSVLLKLGNVTENWKKESIDFVLNNVKHNVYVMFEAIDSVFDKELINKMYKTNGIKPIVYSKYAIETASQIKYFVKNLILFKPEQQQKAFAAYNTFLTKLGDAEFILCGESTFATPLILMPADDSEPDYEEDDIAEELFGENEPVQESLQTENTELDDDFTVELDELAEEPAVNEETIESEIAKDVDQMFFSESEPSESLEELTELPVEETPVSDGIEDEIPYDDMFSEADLDMLDDINSVETDETPAQTPDTEELILDEPEEISIAQEIPVEISAQVQQEEDFSSLADLEDFDAITLEDDDDFFQNTSNDGAIGGFDLNKIDAEQEIKPLDESAPKFNIQQENLLDTPPIIESFEEPQISSIPVYKTELDNAPTIDGIKITEGNIVYHEKYGRGVVEELITYGKKTLCSIQFDNIGRRLLDPNLADLKQM